MNTCDTWVTCPMRQQRSQVGVRDSKFMSASFDVRTKTKILFGLDGTRKNKKYLHRIGN